MRLPPSNSKLICANARGKFSAYLDGQMSGIEMASMATHLNCCEACKDEFAGLRAMQATLAQLGTKAAPLNLQTRLRAAIAQERTHETHLPLPRRWLGAWKLNVAPMAFRATAAFSLTVALVGGLSWLFSAPLAVEANDDKMANLTAPRYLYSQVPPRSFSNDAPVLVEAQVDATGRVYDFTIVEGPKDPKVKQQITENLLGSIFKPAEAFGTPVNGHVMLTFSGISVRG